MIIRITLMRCNISYIYVPTKNVDVLSCRLLEIVCVNIAIHPISFSFAAFSFSLSLSLKANGTKSNDSISLQSRSSRDATRLIGHRHPVSSSSAPLQFPSERSRLHFVILLSRRNVIDVTHQASTPGFSGRQSFGRDFGVLNGPREFREQIETNVGFAQHFSSNWNRGTRRRYRRR